MAIIYLVTPSPVPSDSVAASRNLSGVLLVGTLGVIIAAVPSSLFDLDRHTASKEFALHLTALVCVTVLVGGLKQIRLSVIDLLLVAWLAWSAASFLAATNYWLAWRSFTVSLSGAVLYWAGRSVAAKGRELWLCRGMAILAVTAAMIGIAQAHGLDSKYFFADSRIPGGTFGNRNFLAHFSVISSPILGLVALTVKSLPGRFLASLGTAVVVHLVVLTRSRAAWLAGLVCLVAMGAALWRSGWLKRQQRGLAISLGLIVVMATLGAITAILTPNSLSWRSESPYRDTLSGLVDGSSGSGRGRIIQFTNSAKLIASSPLFGVGPGNWAVAYPLVTFPGDPSFSPGAPIPSNPWPSSDWMALAAERGIPGALLLVLVLASLFISAIRRLDDQDEMVRLKAVTLLGLITATAICGLFDAVLLLAPPTILYWTMAGGLAPRLNPVISASDYHARGRLFLIPLVVAVLTAATLRSASQVAGVVIADTGRDIKRVTMAALVDPGNFRLHLILGERLPCQRALPHSLKAVAQYPHHPSAKRILSRCRRGVST